MSLVKRSGHYPGLPSSARQTGQFND